MYVNISRVSITWVQITFSRFKEYTHESDYIIIINSYTNNILITGLYRVRKHYERIQTASKALYTSLSLTTINKIPLHYSNLYDHIRTIEFASYIHC